MKLRAHVDLKILPIEKQFMNIYSPDRNIREGGGNLRILGNFAPKLEVLTKVHRIKRMKETD